jgi:putative toxin-antitoxin system antitoxin component (TIGR02293 family)
MFVGQKSFSMKSAKKNTKLKPYPIIEHPVSLVNDYAVAYSTLDLKAVHLLGVEKRYQSIDRETDFIELIRAGISKKSLDHLISLIGYSIAEIADIIHVSDRNLRRYTADEKLNTEQSERLVEMARLYSKGEEVFGAMDSFKTWMSSEILALGNQKPKSFLDTSLGIDMLMKELGRIEHGVFA